MELQYLSVVTSFLVPYNTTVRSRTTFHFEHRFTKNNDTLLTDLHFIDINFRTIKLTDQLHDQNKLLQKPEAIKYGI